MTDEDRDYDLFGNPIPTERERYLERMVAIHEAGHAVAFVRLTGERPLSYTYYVTIEATEDYLGLYMEADLGSDCRPGTTGMADAIAAAAGYGATIVAGYPEEEAGAICGNDFEYIDEWTGIPVDAAKHKAVEFMRQPENFAAVERVADQLLVKGTLFTLEVERLIEG